MPDTKSIRGVPHEGSRTAVGVARIEFPMVLVEATGALGVLVAERRCPDDTLERVLYFRSLMGQPYAGFFDAVELLSIDGFYLARTLTERALFYEPSSIPYGIESLSKREYERSVDDVVAYRNDRAEALILETFSKLDGFSKNADGSLKAPDDYANAMDQFMASHKFVEPNEPSSRGD